MKRSARAHIAAFTATFVTFLVVSVLWVLNLRLGAPEGLVTAAAAFTVPFALVILTAIWFFIRAAMHGRMEWHLIAVLPVTIVVPLVILTVYCGPIACYIPGPPNYMMGVFVVGGVALIALVHHLVLNSYPLEPENG